MYKLYWENSHICIAQAFHFYLELAANHMFGNDNGGIGVPTLDRTFTVHDNFDTPFSFTILFQEMPNGLFRTIAIIVCHHCNDLGYIYWQDFNSTFFSEPFA
tara:strand:- start:7851 stop:8156 length:306 start_codon:yes stop_codon:yes gene_type:complete